MNKDKLVCKICGREYKGLIGLSIHVVKIHKISKKEYYDKYLKKEGEGICLGINKLGKKCENKTNFMGLWGGYHKYCTTKCMANSKEVEEKKIKTNLRKYNFKSSNQSPEVKEKSKQTIKEENIKNPNRPKEILEKMKRTSLENNGVDNIFKDVEYIRECKNKKWGVDSWAKTDKGRLCLRINAIKWTEVQKLNNEPLCPHIGDNERNFLNILQPFTIYNIIRNDHDIAIKIGRFPDGHIIELKLFIQFDERLHFLDESCKIYRQDDLDCTKQLESLGYRVWRISELEWKNNREKVIEQFKSLVKELTELYVK